MLLASKVFVRPERASGHAPVQASAFSLCRLCTDISLLEAFCASTVFVQEWQHACSFCAEVFGRRSCVGV